MISEQQSSFEVEQSSFTKLVCLKPMSAIFTTYENQALEIRGEVHLLLIDEHKSRNSILTNACALKSFAKNEQTS